MKIVELNLENIRGIRQLRFRLGPPKASVTDEAGSGSWIVLAGPNGAGKTTLLRCIAAACVGPDILPRMQVESWDWISVGEGSARVTLHVAEEPGDDLPDGDRPPEERDVRGVGVGLKWTPDSVELKLPQRRNHAFVYSRLWVAQPEPPQKGWMVVGLGASRTRAPATSLADELLGGPPRRASIVTLFRTDATLRLSLDWVTKATHRGDGPVAVLERVIEPLLASLGALVFDETTEAKVDNKGIWMKRRGSWVSIADVGMGAESLCASVCEILYRMYQFFGPQFLDDAGWRNGEPPAWMHGPQVLRPGVVLIDEAENHLHPSLQQRLPAWLRLRFPNVQFIATTHSPYVAQAADRLFVFGARGTLDELRDEDMRAVVNGSVDDAVTSRLFGLPTPYSLRGQELRAKLGDIESEMQQRPVSPAKIAERKQLLAQLPHGVDHEVALALRRLADGE